MKEKRSKISSHWYTNGSERKRFNEGQEPEGWYQAPKLKRKPKHWITDGITERLISIDAEIPAGWNIGISEGRKLKIKMTEKGKSKSEHQHEAVKRYHREHSLHWYTNGEIDGTFEEGAEPVGWIKGQSEKHKEHNSLGNIGKKMSKESSIKRVATRRKNGSYMVKLETRQKLRDANLGKIQTIETIQKRNNTKLKNNSFNKSKVQEILQNLFLNLYEDTKIEYSEDSRYPFACDVYIPRFDLFIEINGHWTHGTHPFDPSNKNDLIKLSEIRSKQHQYLDKNNNLKNNSYYIAENVWTVLDPLKFKYAADNNLNYLVLYNVTEENIKVFENYELEKCINGINVMSLDEIYKKYENNSNYNV